MEEKTREALQQENEALRERLREAEEVLDAIRQGEVDALVVSDAQGERIYTLQSSDRAYRIFIDTMSEGAVTLLSDGTILYGNNRIEEILRAPLTKVVGSSIFDFIFPVDRKGLEALLGRVRGGSARGEMRLLAGDGTAFPVRLSISALELEDASVFCIVVSDLSEEKRVEEELSRHRDHLERLVEERTAELRESEDRLRKSLGEKEVLLKEVHHRVKNNMQVISSLVALQANAMQEEAMRAALQDVTHRVRSMAMVHEKLYQSADLARVQFDEYARSLLNYLWRAHGCEASGIRLALDLEPVSLSVDAAVPCGLILNELATNALKHAFGGRADGVVTLSLRGAAEGQVSLCVRDNGVGLPAGLDWMQANTLGLRLVQMLTAQLDAAVEASSLGGTEFTITFERPKT